MESRIRDILVGRYRSLLLGTAVVGIGIGLLLWKGLPIDLEELREAGYSIRPSTFLLAACFVLIQVAAQCARFWSLFPSPPQRAFGHVARAFGYGQLLNVFFPARAGDALKIVYLQGEPERVPMPESAGVLVVDKVVDAVTLLSIAFIALASQADKLRETLGGLPTGPVVTGAIALLLAIVCAILLFRSKQEKIRSALVSFGHGLSSLKRPKKWLAGAILSCVARAAEITALALLCQSQGMTPPVPLLIWALLCLNVGIAIPVTFANVGTFEAALSFVLTSSGMGLAPALAVATAHHLLQIVGFAAWALLCFAARTGRP